MGYSADSPDPTGSDDPLDGWRRHVVVRILRILAAVGVPLLLIDSLNQIHYERWSMLLYSLSTIVATICLAFAPRLNYRLRAYSIVALFLVGSLLGVLHFGLFGITYTVAIFSVVFATLLLGSRAAIVTLALLALGFGVIFAGFSTGMFPYPEQFFDHVTATRVLMNHWLLLAGSAAILMLTLGSLVKAFQTSLYRTQSAQATLERLNQSLHETAEQQAAIRLRYAEALAACSRLLLSPATDKSAFTQVLSEVLTIIRATVSADRISLARYTPHAAGEAEMRRSYEVLAHAEAPNLPPQRPPTADELRDMPEVLNVWHQSGGGYNGPLAELLEAHPTFRQYCEDNAVRSVLIESLRAGERWWGHISVNDHRPERHWDSDAVKFLQTAAEMIVTYTEGWEANYALQEREALLRSVNETFPDGFIYQLIQRTDGSYERFTYVNPGVERLFGIPAQQILNNPMALRSKVHPDDLNTVMQLDEVSVQQRAPFEVEARLFKADGRIGWFHVRSVITQDLDKERSVWNGMALEITARKQAELALADQLRYAEALASCSHVLLADGAATNDWAETIRQALEVLRSAIGCSRLALRFYRTATEIPGVPNFIIATQDPSVPLYREYNINPRDIPQALIERIAAGGWLAGSTDELFPEDNSIRRQLEANNHRSLLFIGFQVAGLWRGYLAVSDTHEAWDWSEPLLAFFRTGLDMIAAFIHQSETTATLRTREALLYATQARQESLLQAIPDLLLGVSAAGSIHFAHVPPETPLTLPATVIGRQLREVLPETITTVLADALVNPNPERRLISLSADQTDAPHAKILEGRVVAMGTDERLIILRDVTAQQRLNDALARARDAAEAAAEAKSTFLATMSHEIRTPLNAVIGMASILQDTTLSPEQHKYVEIIGNGGRALLAVISDILDFSRIEAGRMELEEQPFDLHDCLCSTVELIANEADGKGLQVTCAYSPDLPQIVIGDAGRLRQVLLNLLSNAVKFTDHGEVQLYAAAPIVRDQHTLVTISIRDTGIGMTSDQLQRIFEPFVQGDNSISRRFGGTGLGLAISRQLVELMGGRLDVQSRPAAGSTFSLTIPFTVSTEARSVQPLRNHAGVKPALHILVAEDNPINQDVIRVILERMGHKVTVVNNGRQAVEAVQALPFDVVLMDVQMPIMDGEAATRHIRALAGSVTQPPIVALTANALAEDRERLLQSGMNGYLSKPVQPAALQHMLTNVATDPTPASRTTAAPPARPVSRQLIDWDEIRHLTDALNLARPVVLGIVLKVFEETISAQLDAIDAAIDTDNPEQRRLAAYHLREGCVQIGAQAMAEICRCLEHTDHNLDYPALATELHTCYSETYALLRKHITPTVV